MPRNLNEIVRSWIWLLGPDLKFFWKLTFGEREKVSFTCLFPPPPHTSSPLLPREPTWCWANSSTCWFPPTVFQSLIKLHRPEAVCLSLPILQFLHGSNSPPPHDRSSPSWSVDFSFKDDVTVILPKYGLWFLHSSWNFFVFSGYRSILYFWCKIVEWINVNVLGVRRWTDHTTLLS